MTKTQADLFEYVIRGALPLSDGRPITLGRLAPAASGRAFADFEGLIMAEHDRADAEGRDAYVMRVVTSRWWDPGLVNNGVMVLRFEMNAFDAAASRDDPVWSSARHDCPVLPEGHVA